MTPTKYVGALLQGGVRSGARTETTAGVIDASAIIGSAAIVFSPSSDPSRKFGVDAGPEMFLTRAHYESRGPAETRKDDGTAAHVSLVGHGWIGIVGPLRISATLRAGAPLHPVRIVAANEKVSGVGGILLGGQLSVGMGW